MLPLPRLRRAAQEGAAWQYQPNLRSRPVMTMAVMEATVDRRGTDELKPEQPTAAEAPNTLMLHVWDGVLSCRTHPFSQRRHLPAVDRPGPVRVHLLEQRPQQLLIAAHRRLSTHEFLR